VYVPKGGLAASVEMRIGRSEDDRVGHVKSLRLVIGSDDVEIRFDRSGKVDQLIAMQRPLRLPPTSLWWVKAGKMLPSLVLLEQENYGDDDQPEWFMEPSDRPFGDVIDTCLSVIAHGNTSRERLQAIASRLQFSDAASFHRQLMSQPAAPPSFKQRVNFLGPEADEMQNLRRAVLLSKLSEIIKLFDDEIDRFALGVRYVEPVRASVERYYREQNLSVEDIDSKGANTAVFLGSLDEHAMSELNHWMDINFGFKVLVESSTGHIQIFISDQNHAPRNIADLGFGYSQLLPIVLQLWRSRPGSSRPPSVLAIEQPELHLHPQFQAVLADVIAAAAAPRNAAPLFIETHSDHLVNRIGSLVSEGKIKAEDVQVLVVSEDDFGDSIARKVEFTPSGVLDESWPPGFFTPVR
jgi:hypothetical protein